ncbi:MAG: NAD-dependent dehydratase [Parcubacteria group bacterium]|nr:NAD-dependent dehydratase [Parcubacteria group bacterium]
MKSIVTGGAGFIGSHLVDRLVKMGHKVIVLDNFSTGRKLNLSHHTGKNIKIIKVDISENRKLDKYFKGVHYIFHLAGIADIVPSIENPHKYFKSNVIGTVNVIKAAKNQKIKKFIYAASASCYGFPKKFPTKENEKIKPMYPYSFVKWQAEEFVMHWAKIFDFPAISLRFFNTYGPRSRTSGAYGAVFGVFFAQKLANKPLTIVGNGNQTRDFVHVDDLVSAIIKAAQSKKVGEIYNVGSGKEVTVNKIAKLIGGKRTHIPKRPGEPDRSLADISKIKKDLKWKPKIKIEKGVKELLSKIDYWKEAPVWTPKSIKKATRIWFKLLKKR